MARYLRTGFRSIIQRREWMTEMSTKLWDTSKNFNRLLVMLSAVNSEFRPVPQIRFQARCNSNKPTSLSSNKSLNAYAPSELMPFVSINKLFNVALPLSASQSSMTPFEPRRLLLKSSNLRDVLSIKPYAISIAPSMPIWL